jgi:hypothetical protein
MSNKKAPRHLPGFQVPDIQHSSCHRQGCRGRQEEDLPQGGLGRGTLSFNCLREWILMIGKDLLAPIAVLNVLEKPVRIVTSTSFGYFWFRALLMNEP